MRYPEQSLTENEEKDRRVEIERAKETGGNGVGERERKLEG